MNSGVVPACNPRSKCPRHCLTRLRNGPGRRRNCAALAKWWANSADSCWRLPPAWPSAAIGVLLVAGIALKVSIWQVDRDIQAREQALEKIIVARDQALAGQASIDKTLAMRPPAGQVQLLSTVARIMRGPWQLVEWKMADADNLQLTVSMPTADPSAIVTAWEASGQFTDVTAEMGAQRNQVIVKARILRSKPRAAR